MKNFSNIEKLSGKSHYTGYCAGTVYRITKIDGGGWRARAENIHGSFVHELIIRNTLEGISNELQRRADHIEGK